MTSKYQVIDRQTELIVQEGFATRAAARQAKKELELKLADGQNRPSVYAVETGVDNKRGAGIYLH